MLPMAKARGGTLSLVSIGAFFPAVFADNVFSHTKKPQDKSQGFRKKNQTMYSSMKFSNSLRLTPAL